MAGRWRCVLRTIGPGILVAATGVGAGDLATGAFTGNKLGLAILWAVVIGAAFKFVINEGLARWQLATGETLLEGAVHHLGRPVQWFFAVYLVAWSFLVGLALISACGATAHAILPLFGSPETDKNFYAVLHSLLALGLVQWGGFRLFEQTMNVCIAVMFVVVLATAAALQPPVSELVSGLLLPSIPDASGEGLGWTIALMGGVGGTLTVLCYGYWIRELGREGPEAMRTCRWDLAIAYTLTALFGMAMVVIGSRTPPISGGGSGLIVSLATELETSLGDFGHVGKWAFLCGAWGAVFSSLLGVWQSVPYIFADFWYLSQTTRHASNSDIESSRSPMRSNVTTRCRPYQFYLWGLSTVPALGLFTIPFTTAQKIYAIVGALCIPMLAAVLLRLNGQTRLVGPRFRNSWFTSGVLLIALLLFLIYGGRAIHIKWFR
ncbi:MAG: Nramp family divalent metal transporter [Planctomycetaceae bacterium]